MTIRAQAPRKSGCTKLTVRFGLTTCTPLFEYSKTMLLARLTRSWPPDIKFEQ